MQDLRLPPGYRLEWDSDIVTLLGKGEESVALFSVHGACPDEIRRTAEASYRNPSGAPTEKSARESVRLDLQVRFFGDFEVICRGEPLSPIRNKKALSILKYMLAHRCRPVSRDHLMDWLWPESSLKKARWSLNSTIRILRQSLDCGHSSFAFANYVLFESGCYLLSPDVRTTSDKDEFDARHKAGRRLEKSGQMTEATLEYEKAIELYRDDYLVEDLYEDWTMIERERLISAYVDMLHRLASHYMETGRLEQGIQACYRLLAKDPCHEDSYRLLMQCYTRLGLRDRALRHFQVCEQMLCRRYGTAPSSSTLGLNQSILSGEVV